MATNQQYTLSNDVWHVFCEWTVTAAGAVVPNADGTTTTEPEISVARTGTGTYVVTIPGNFQKTIHALPSYRNATPASSVANITAIGLGTGALQAGGGVQSTVTVVTGASNATPAAADLTSGQIGVNVKFQKHKI